MADEVSNVTQVGETVKRIKKIKLSNNQVYSIFDEGALRLDSTGKLITGNDVVDKLILEGDLYITEVDDMDVATSNVLVQETSTGLIKRRSADKLLEDIGGYSASVNSNILQLKLGK